jgi:hypothetical protein
MTQELEARIAELEKERAEWQDLTTKAIHEAREVAIAETEQKLETRMLLTQVRAEAAPFVYDPDDLLAHIPFDSLTVDDIDGIREAIAAVVKKRPYLLRSGALGSYDGDFGVRGTVATSKKERHPSDWLRAQFEQED